MRLPVDLPFNAAAPRRIPTHPLPALAWFLPDAAVEVSAVIRIVLADDHKLVRESLRKALSRVPDLEVVGEAVDGREAVAIITRLAPDVALVDMRMPELNGAEVIQAVRVASPTTRCLVLSAFGDEDWIMAAAQAGAAGYLLKTVRTHDLAAVIRAVHAGATGVTDPRLPWPAT